MTSTDHAFKEMTEFVITPDDVGETQAELEEVFQ